MDWRSWHDEYDVPGSWQARRLRTVQGRVRAFLDGAPDGPLRVVSVCAGQGRDLLQVLAGHPRRADVRARLVELDERNTALAADFAREAGLGQVEVVTGDASRVEAYRGMTPADLVLVCGLFGNITDEDIERTVDACRRLCAVGGTVIWTRHRGAPDRVPLICEWFAERGFTLEWLSEPDVEYGVGEHRFGGELRPAGADRDGDAEAEAGPEADERMFRFVGFDVLLGS